MISHLVLLKPRHDLPDEARRVLGAALRKALTEIPSVRGARIGRRVVHGAGYERGMPDSGEFVAILDFDDLAGLQAYLAHPAHVDLGQRFNEAMESALVYDFEVGGIERIDALSAPPARTRDRAE